MFRSIVLVGVYGGLLMPLVFLPIVIFPFVFSKLVAFQILIGLTFPAYLILAWLEPRYRPRSHLLYTAILAYFVAVGLSVAFSVDPFRSWWGNQERMNGLFTLLHFLAWLTMAVGTLHSWPQWRRLLNYQIVISVVMALVALMQKVKPDLLLFPAGSRVGGLLDNPIYMGAYQIFNLSFLALLAFKSSSRDARWWYLAFAVIDFGAFLATGSRGALVGLAVGLAAFAGYYVFFSKNKKARYGIVGLVAVAFSCYGLLFAFRDTKFVQGLPVARLLNFTETADTRLIAWRIAWQGFVDRPLTGWGMDTFHILFNLKYNPYSLRYGQYETWFDRSHNTVLDVLSMTGIFGFVTFAWIFLSLFISNWKAFRKGWIDLPISAILFALPIAYFVQNLFVFDHPAAFSMSYLLFALVIAATQGEFVGATAPVTAAADGKRGIPWVSFGFLQVLGLLFVWRTSMLPFEASRLSIRSNNTFGTPIALTYAKQASEIWTPYLDEQTFLLSRNLIVYASQDRLKDLSNAREYYDLVTRLTKVELERHPRNTHTHFTNAQLATAFSSQMPQEISVAEREFRLAIETSPKRQQLFYGLANLYLRTNRVPDAIALYRQVRDFDLELGEGHWMYGLATFYDANNRQEGAKELIASQNVRYPYRLKEGRELVPLADAYLTMGDVNGFRGLAATINNQPVAEATFYVQLAYKYDRLQFPEERDTVLAFATQHYSDARQQYDQFVTQQGKMK